MANIQLHFEGFMSINETLSNTRTIYLSNGNPVIVDEEDYIYLSKSKWYESDGILAVQNFLSGINFN